MRLSGILGLAAAVSLGACANQACDPSRDRSIFTVGGCVVGGGYQQRIDTRQDALGRANADYGAARDASGAGLARRDAAAGERSRLLGQISAEQRRTARLQGEIDAARARSQVDRDRAAALQQRVATLRTEQDSLRAADASRPDAAQRLAELRGEQTRLERAWARLRQGAPQE